MKHYVFMKYKEGAFTDELFTELSGMFLDAAESVPGLYGCVVKRNCLERPVNMDLMVSFYAEDAAALKAYIEHPKHLAIAAKSGPLEAARFSFDCEE